MNVVSVKYRQVSGWHVFTSEDVPGLYVASPDAIRAYNDVGPSIQRLLHSYGAEYLPRMSAEDFFELGPEATEERVIDYSAA